MGGCVEPGPGPITPPRLIRKKLDKPFDGFRQLTLLYQFSGGPSAVFGLDTQNNIYIRDGDIIKRIQPNGRIETLVKHKWDPKVIESCEVSYHGEFVYCASRTAISRIDLRTNKGEQS